MLEELRTLRFIEERSNVLFLGPPGVGNAMGSIKKGADSFSHTANSPDISGCSLPPRPCLRISRFPLIAAVTANHCTALLEENSSISPGDEVVLLGNQGKEKITADEIAG